MPLTSRADIINTSVPSITDLTVEDVWLEPTPPPGLSDKNPPSPASQPNEPSIVDKESPAEEQKSSHFQRLFSFVPGGQADEDDWQDFRVSLQ